MCISLICYNCIVEVSRFNVIGSEKEFWASAYTVSSIFKNSEDALGFRKWLDACSSDLDKQVQRYFSL